jgi:hypothetical protein
LVNVLALQYNHRREAGGYRDGKLVWKRRRAGTDNEDAPEAKKAEKALDEPVKYYRRGKFENGRTKIWALP